MSKIAKQIDQQVGERIRKRRAELGMTQQDLAKRLGLSYQQVQKYETGTNRISAGRLYEAVQVLRMEIADLFVDPNTGIRTQPMDHGGHNRSTIEMVRNFALIKDEEMRTAVVQIVRAISGGRHRRRVES